MIGFLDMKDFVTYILSLFGQDSKPPRNLAVNSEQIVDLSHANPFSPIKDDATMEDVIRKICSNNLHRLPVVSKDDINNVVGIVSQSLIIKWLFSKQEQLSPLFKCTVQDLNLGLFNERRPLIQALDTDELINVFQLVHDNNVHGCAVVDNKGKLVGNIAVSDLQYAISGNIRLLALPVRSLLDTSERKAPLVCSSQSTLSDIVSMMIESNVYRIYLVDVDRSPRGIITYTDILDMFFNKLREKSE